MRMLDGAACINYSNARGLLLCHSKITFSHALVKLGLLLVERAQQSTNWSRALSRSSHLGIEIKDNRKVGFEPARREVVELFNHHQIKSASVALKRDGRISVAIRNNCSSSLERRTYEFRNVLRACRDIEQQFGCRGNMLCSIAHHQMAYAFADCSASGLTGDDNIEPAAPQFLGQKFALRALTATVYTFESDKQSAHWIRGLRYGCSQLPW